MSLRKVAIYGAGGFAREVAWLVELCQRDDQDVTCVGFVDDDPARQGTEINGLQVWSLGALHDRHPDTHIAIAIGSPLAREQVFGRVSEMGFAHLSLLHPRSEISRWVSIGPGVVVCGGCTLTTNIRLDRGAQVNLDCTIGHDAILGEFATLAPGVHISGWVHLGKRVYVGTGAVIINGVEGVPLIVGDDAVIGAAACVVRSVAPGTTVVGVPAKSRG